MTLEQLKETLAKREKELAAEIDLARVATQNVERLSGAVAQLRQLIAEEEAPPVPDFTRLGGALFYAAKREKRKERKRARAA